MKKLITLLLITVAFYSQAQMITGKAGMSVAKISSDEFAGFDNKAKAGFLFGLTYSKPIGKSFYFQPELLFIQKGTKFSFSFSDPTASIDADIKLIVNYIELPLMIKTILSTSNSNINLFLNAGPSIALGISGKIKYDLTFDDGVDNFSFSGSEDIKFGKGEPDINGDLTTLYVKRLDVAAQVGGGAIIKEKVIIDLRYGIGLVDIFDGGKSKNNVFQISVGMPIVLKK